MKQALGLNIEAERDSVGGKKEQKKKMLGDIWLLRAEGAER